MNVTYIKALIAGCILTTLIGCAIPSQAVRQSTTFIEPMATRATSTIVVKSGTLETEEFTSNSQTLLFVSEEAERNLESMVLSFLQVGDYLLVSDYVETNEAIYTKEELAPALTRLTSFLALNPDMSTLLEAESERFRDALGDNYFDALTEAYRLAFLAVKEGEL